MERFFQAFKDLYNGENIKKKHLLFGMLLIYPALLASVLNSIDKTTPKDILLSLAIIATILFIGSVVCWIFISGFSLQFIKDRFEGVLGLPLLEKGMFMNGLKVLPLDLTWTFYCIFLIAIFIGVPILLLFPLVSGGGSKLVTLLAIIVAFCIMMVLLVSFMILVVPFMFYLRIEYVKHGGLFGKLFYPLIIVEYMKKAFTDTVLLALKYFLVSFLTSICLNILVLFSGIFVILVSAIVLTLFRLESVVDNPWFVLTTTIIIVSVFQLIYTYINSMISYSAIDNFVEIYNNKIVEND